jgi:SAM-dependent methyltransferase
MPDHERLAEFVGWVERNIIGDEKGQAQVFLDRLFQSFGQAGSLDVGGKPEFRIRKAAEDGGGTSFADFVWKPVVLVEMKKRGEPLQKHYRQAFDYWTRLVPNRPRYVVLCNFDEFWVYDFDTDLDTPKDTVKLAELPDRWGPLAFLAPGTPSPRFGSDREAVTRQAADKLATCFNKLTKRGVEPALAQKFILQMLVALFAEDIDLLPQYFVGQILDDCTTPADTYDLIGGLFEAMNARPSPTGGRYKGVAYFNGGLFANPARIELTSLELVLLREAAKADWSKVQPEIFGTLFQHSLGTDERHAFGAHFTHPADIMKIVGPTIVEPWREQIESAKTLKRLGELRERLHQFRVLDPACGSGNFLYIAYRELKRLEARLIERINTEFPSRAEPDQRQLSFLSAANFYGLDILPFAVEIAKVTMMIARKLAIDELHITENALPLDNLEKNFIAADALFTDWPKADVIIGNPPFLGAKRLKPEHGPDYVNKVRAAYPDVPGMADYCVYWLRKAHDHLPPCTAADPVAGRAGLVGTQNIRNNQSRVGGLDHIIQTGTIVEAVDNQPWSGEANVHVSIANWAKTQDPALLPKTRRLWFKVQGSTKRTKGVRADKTYELNFHECAQINSALSDQTDVAGARDLRCNLEPPRSFNGQMLGHESFLLTDEQRKKIVARDSKSAEIIFPYLNGEEMLTGGKPDRFVLDFGTRNQLEAAAYVAAFEWVKTHVLPDRERKAKEGMDEDGKMRSHHKGFLARWWLLSFGRPELISLIAKLPRYLVISLVSKRPIFVFVSSEIRPSNLLQAFVLADDYSFGVLSSGIHWQWFQRKSSKLTERYRFGETIWNTFPWPQTPTAKQIEAVAAAGREVRRVRAEALTKIKGGLRAVYRTLELPGANPLKDAHAALDAAVLAAYGFDAKKDLLAQLLALNLEVAAKIKAGQPVTAPGIPPGFPNAAKLVTTDCIQPQR